MSLRGGAADPKNTPERDTVELLLETPELPPERREALAQELQAVVARHLPGRPVRLLSGVDGKGRRWLRLVIPLGPRERG